VEDRGPVFDPLTEAEVRRVNMIVYVNYGEPNARIIHGSDHDLEDIRTAEHNRFVEQRIKEFAGGVGELVEAWERRQLERIKASLREYYVTKDEAAKREFEAANAVYPFLFSRAWREIKDERARPPEAQPAAAPAPAASAAEAEVQYPLDAELRDRVMDIERLIRDLERDLDRLRERGSADDILQQTCNKLVNRAREVLTGKAGPEFTARRLDSTRAGLVTTWRQIKSRLKAG
jgi:hypothetical protein